MNRSSVRFRQAAPVEPLFRTVRTTWWDCWGANGKRHEPRGHESRYPKLHLAAHARSGWLPAQASSNEVACVSTPGASERRHVGLDGPDAEEPSGRWAATWSCGNTCAGKHLRPGTADIGEEPGGERRLGPIGPEARLQLQRCWVAWPPLGTAGAQRHWSACPSRAGSPQDGGPVRCGQAHAVMEVDLATRTTVTLEDDISGGPATETLQFRLGAAEYEIDLNAKNARRFRTQMAPFIDHARKAGRRQRRPARPGSPVSTVPTSGPGRKRTTSRSATAGASRPASSNSTKRGRRSADRYRYRLDHGM